MMSRHICPNCGGKKFDTVAHIQQSWEVDEEGNFIQVLIDCIAVTHGPDDANIWTCTSCGTEAIIIKNRA